MGANLATLVTETGEPASSLCEKVGGNCGRVKFPHGIEFASVVTGAGGPCVPLV